MGNLAPAFVLLHPNYMVPELLLPYSQASGAWDLLGGGEPMVRLGEGDLAAYVRRLDVRTKVAGGQASYNELPSCSIAFSMIATASYLIRVRAEYDHHDTRAVSNWGTSIVEAQRLAMQQAHAQFLRDMLLYGMNPANGEGIVNTNGATAINLPADSNGDTTVVTYDNGEMAFFLLSRILAIKSRTNQLGIGKKFVFLGPQRVLGQFEYNVVQLVQYQRPGAGTTSTVGVVKDVAEVNEDDILWCYDDTLIGQGAGGTDLVILAMPEVSKPKGAPLNTNKFAELAPGLAACIMQLCDMVSPREITTPLAAGATDVLSELRSTSGWGLRPEVIDLISMQYS